MAKNTDKAQLALGDHAARQLANATALLHKPISKGLFHNIIFK